MDINGIMKKYKIKIKNPVIGVPITFLDKYCPEQFEILGCSYQYGDCGKHIEGKGWGVSVNNKDIYKRIFIRHKK